MNIKSLLLGSIAAAGLATGAHAADLQKGVMTSLDGDGRPESPNDVGGPTNWAACGCSRRPGKLARGPGSSECQFRPAARPATAP